MAIKLKVELKRLDEETLTHLILSTNRLPRETPFIVYFSDKKPLRTMKQNRYLWGVVYLTLSEHTGYQLEEVHEFCKEKFALRTTYDLSRFFKKSTAYEDAWPEPSTVHEAAMSTKIMSTKQMSEYIDKIRQWSQDDLGLHIPSPNELTDENYINSLDHY